MRAVVVHDQMHVQVPRDGGIHGIQELPELGRALPLMKLGNELTRLDVKRSKHVVVPCRR